MSADKRRRGRIQGGCNASPPTSVMRPQAKPFHEGSSAHEIGADGAEGDGFDATVLGTTADPAAVAPGETGTSKAVLKSTFQYVETTPAPLARKKPDVRTIVRDGFYVLSNGPSGPSTIYYDPFYLHNSIADELYQTILQKTKWEQKSIEIKGERYPMPREVAWYGPIPYTYSGATMVANEDWPPYIVAIHDILKERQQCEFNSVLLNLYRNEHNSVGWHSDDELSMGVQSKIASVSLGGTRVFEMRKKPPPEENGSYEYMEHVKLQLGHGSLLIMDGCTQQDWQHRIPKEYHSRETRINLTFRTITNAE